MRALEYAPGIKDKYYAQLKGYQIMPEKELFTFQVVVLEPTLERLLSRPGLRAKCTHCGEEIINERQVRVEGKVLCRHCAGQGYYRII
jgi:formylmethanofuran dehydrogenase subunit E